MLFNIVNYFTGTKLLQNGNYPSKRDEYSGNFEPGKFTPTNAAKVIAEKGWPNDWGIRDNDGNFYKYINGDFCVNNNGWKKVNL
jgi:hypothetical protein